ncbi:ArsR family transcriptional regulator [Dermabacter hominis]|uniref:ArsR family transcriptional regulator n=1 Tax=Dermabacter hominis TaxID=36740 RepID=UPI0031840CB9
MPSPLESVALVRGMQHLADLDFKRSVLIAKSQGKTQAEIAQAARMSQSAVSQHLKQARNVAFPPDGFAGASPLEICERYAAGQISSEDLKSQLVTWDFPPMPQPSDIFDDDPLPPPGTWAEVEQALSYGYLSEELYEAVLDECEARGLD